MKLFIQWVLLMATGLVLAVGFSRVVWSGVSTYIYFNR